MNAPRKINWKPLVYTAAELKLERWRKVPGFERYLVSSLGRIFSKKRTIERHRQDRIEIVPRKGKYLRSSSDTIGYPQVKLYSDQQIFKTLKVHLVVALAFISNPDDLPFVNHKDGDKNNCRLGNLERCTAKENTNHAWKIGLCTAMKGENQNTAKLKDWDIPEIRLLFKKGFTNSAIGNRYGVTGTCIYYIRRGATWKHL